MFRYLFNLSYIGTNFRGSQRLWGTRMFEDPSTIEGNIELALVRSSYVITSQIEFSSRTDSGVHALGNTFHVDLKSKHDESINCNDLLKHMNNYFHKKNLPINVKSIQRVSDDFHCRKLAKSRTYLYRLAILRDSSKVKYRLSQIEEWKRSWYYQFPEWDIDKFREGAALLVGKHDFETFRKVNKTGSYQENIRNIYSINVERSDPLITSLTQTNIDIEYYNVVIKGKSFVHNQIRRMVGALNHVAINKLSLRDLQLMLHIPSRHSWPVSCDIAPPYGLYLVNIEYNPEDTQPLGESAVVN